MDPSDTVIAVFGQRFTSIQELISYLGTLSAVSRYEAQMSVLETLTSYNQQFEDLIERFLNYVQQDEAWHAATDPQTFANQISDYEAIARRARDTRNRVAEARKTIIGIWGNDAAPFIESVTGYQQLSSIRKGCRAPNSPGYRATMLKVNEEIIRRMESKASGVSNTSRPTTRDFDRAFANDTPGRPISPGTLGRHGLKVGSDGLLYTQDLAGGGRILGEIGAPRMQSIGQALAQPSQTRSSQRAPPIARPITPVPSDVMPSIEQPDIQMTSPRGTHATLLRHGRGLSDTSELSDSGARLRALGLDDSDADDDDDDGTYVDEGGAARLAAKRKRGIDCLCADGVTKAWKDRVSARPKRNDVVRSLLTLKDMMGFVSARQRICFAHLKAMGGHMGLQVKQLNTEGLKARLAHLWTNRERLIAIKTDDATYAWFRRTHRPLHPNDALGAYRYPHRASPQPTFQIQPILARHGVSYQRWQDVGSVVIPGLFDWWWSQKLDLGPDFPEKCIGDVVDAEFELYLHHLRRQNDKPNMGWLRNMYFSIAQQLMRQDPCYYSIYVALRPDNAWRLASYPYYTKFSLEGDSTYFRHIDINLNSYAETGRGGNMIQGSVSLDDEDPNCCTVILPGMHKHIVTWWAKVCERGQKTDGFVHRIDNKMFSAEDGQEFGTQWRREVCKHGDARITMSTLPHGSDGPATGKRRTMLPWFIKIQNDHDALETLESGTWDELSKAHIRLEAPPSTPSGLSNRYGKILYRFPAAVEITGLGALSDALVCRQMWTSPSVIRERDIALGGDDAKYHAYVARYRDRAIRAAIEGFQDVKAAERASYGDNSYFHLLDVHGAGNIPVGPQDSDADPFGELDEDDAGFVTHDDELEFAEASMPVNA